MDWKDGSSILWGSVGEAVSAPKMTELLHMDEASFEKRFSGTAIARIGHERMSRNAAVGLGNVGTLRELGSVLRAAMTHESRLVREHSWWAAVLIMRRALLFSREAKRFLRTS